MGTAVFGNSHLKLLRKKVSRLIIYSPPYAPPPPTPPW